MHVGKVRARALDLRPKGPLDARAGGDDNGAADLVDAGWEICNLAAVSGLLEECVHHGCLVARPVVLNALPGGDKEVGDSDGLVLRARAGKQAFPVKQTRCLGRRGKWARYWTAYCSGIAATSNPEFDSG